MIKPVLTVFSSDLWRIKSTRMMKKAKTIAVPGVEDRISVKNDVVLLKKDKGCSLSAARCFTERMISSGEALDKQMPRKMAAAVAVPPAKHRRDVRSLMNMIKRMNKGARKGQQVTARARRNPEKTICT